MKDIYYTIKERNPTKQWRYQKIQLWICVSTDWQWPIEQPVQVQPACHLNLALSNKETPTCQEDCLHSVPVAHISKY